MHPLLRPLIAISPLAVCIVLIVLAYAPDKNKTRTNDADPRLR